MNKWLILGIILLGAAGMFGGLNQTILFHQSAFKAKFPNADRQNWQPLPECDGSFIGSWTNKYRNYPTDKRERFFGSSTFLVSFTDAYHATRELEEWTRFFGIIFLMRWVVQKDKVWLFLLFCVGWYVVKSIGFHLVYTIFFK
jgi:hypothetical protein